MSVPTNLIPTKITGLPEYTGSSTLGYFPYVLEGRTYQVQFANLAAVGAVPSTRVVAAGTGLTGGGDLSENRVIAIANGGVGYSQLANSGVTAGSYGSGSQIPVLTIDDKGRVTSATSVSLSISGYVPDSRRVDTDASLTGGGPLSSNLTLGVNYYASLPQALGSASAGVSTAAARGDHVHPAVDLSDATQTQGALPLGRGGTGDALSPVAGAVVYSTGTKFALADPGLPGQVLTSAGTGEPYWTTVTGTGTVTSVDLTAGTGISVAGGPITAAGSITVTNTAPDQIVSLTGGGTTVITGAYPDFTITSSEAYTGTVTSVAASGGTTGLTFSGGPITTSGTLTLGGTLGVANGGTGATTLTGLVKGNGTSAFTAAASADVISTLGYTPANKAGEAFTGNISTTGTLAVTGATTLTGSLTANNTNCFLGPATGTADLNLYLRSTNVYNFLYFQKSGSTYGSLIGQSTVGMYYNFGQHIFRNGAGSSEYARIDSSGNLLVGTTSAVQLLTLGSGSATAAGINQRTTQTDFTITPSNSAGGGVNITYSWVSGGQGPLRFSTSSGEVMRLDAAGNLGIGTTAPSNQLSVAGNNTATISLDWTGDNAAKAWFSANHSTGEVRHAAVTNYFPTFYSNNSERMRIDLSGNVGIGTSSPYSRFTIVPSSTPTTVAGANQITVGESTANSAYRLQIGYLNNGASGYNGSIQVYDNGNAQSLILNGAGGNVGIGTSSPGEKLTVSGNGQFSQGTYCFVGATSGTVQSQFAANAGSGVELRAVSNHPMAFFTNNTERMRITSGGDVGIGTSSPGAKLDVSGVAVASTDASTGNSPLVAANINSGSNTTKYTSLLFQGRDTINSGKNVGLVQCGPSDINWVTSYLAFQTRESDALTERMRITSSGNVGIGVTNPVQKLEVAGSIVMGSGLITGTGAGTGDVQIELGGNRSGSGNSYIDWHSTAGADFESRIIRYAGTNGGLDIINTGTGGTVLSNSGVAPIVFQTNGTERARITGSGDVGIGTSSPSGALNVVDQNNTIFYLDEYSNVDGAVIRARRYRGTIASPSAVQTGDTLTALRGFGYTSAGSMGSLSASIDFYAAENFTSTAQGAFISFRTNAAGGAGAAAERMRIDSSGNVGIGTTDPKYQLHAFNDGGFTRNLASTASSVIYMNKGRGSGSSPANINNGDNLGGIWFCGYSGSGSNNGYAYGAYVQGEADGAISGTSVPGRLTFATTTSGNSSPTERMRINSSGDVLVNTSTTFGKFSVYGTAGFNADSNNPISGSGSFKFRGTAGGTTITTYDYLNYTAMQFIRDNGNPTNTVGSITCTDTATTYNTSSDRRLKKDIVPAGDAGAVIDAIEIVSHGWKASEGTVPFGVIAQDLYAVAPLAVHAGDEGEEIEDVWSVDYSKLVPMMLKEIQSLRARVAQLEGN